MAEGDGKIGINEVRLGLPLPVIVIETFRAQLPPRVLADAALEGRLYTPREAAAAGVVDEVVDPPDLEARARETARRLSEGGGAFAGVKRMLRRPAAEALEKRAGEDADAWLDGWFSEPARRRIAEVVAGLAKRRTG
jgi:enoyl-CoA hydratase